jgi:hypothetical protein
VLFEIATDDPGFTVDEPKETLGNAIKLPPWCESRRAEIVAALAPLRRSPARQGVAGDGAAKFLSARLARGLFLLCAHGHEAIMSAHGDAEDMKRS